MNAINSLTQQREMRVCVLTAMAAYEREAYKQLLIIIAAGVHLFGCISINASAPAGEGTRRADRADGGKVVAGIQKDAARVHNSALYIAP